MPKPSRRPNRLFRDRQSRRYSLGGKADQRAPEPIAVPVMERVWDHQAHGYVNRARILFTKIVYGYKTKPVISLNRTSIEIWRQIRNLPEEILRAA